jgi:hypothetical protein
MIAWPLRRYEASHNAIWCPILPQHRLIAHDYDSHGQHFFRQTRCDAVSGAKAEAADVLKSLARKDQIDAEPLGKPRSLNDGQDDLA